MQNSFRIHLPCITFNNCWFRSLILAMLLLVLLLGVTGCGGGGSNSSSAPHIYAVLISFPQGTAPTGFNNNCSVAVQDSSSGSPITNAVVTVNSVTLTYNAANQDYEGNVVVAGGSAVTLSVTAGGNTYTASGAQFTSYPTISTPVSGVIWVSNVGNTVTWADGTVDANSLFELGVVDSANPEGKLVWPSGNSLMALPTSTTSYLIPTNSLTTGSRLVMVGAVKEIAISGAASNSALIISGFNYTPITVMSAPLVSIAVTSQYPTIAVGGTNQLTATGMCSDGSTLDLTTLSNWTSSVTSTATAGANGLITGTGSGAAKITASYGGISGSASFNVFQTTPSPSPPLSQSVAYQIDYAHSGHAVFSSVSFPSSPAWSVSLNGAVSYPLIVGGMVFVLTSNPGSSGYGTSLYALNEQTGGIVWGPVKIAGTYNWSGFTYDHGKLFVINFDGLLQSFDAATGQAGWSLGQLATNAPPTAVNGVLYVGGGKLFAIDETNGNLLWSSFVNGGDNSSPTVSNDGVFVSYPCQVYKFDPVTGSSLWHYSGGCDGGGGYTPAYANGLLYVRDFEGNQIFNSATGSVVGTFTATPIPAFSSQTGFFLNSGTLRGIDLVTQNILWSFAGDGGLVSAPIVINQYVIVGSSSGKVYALDASTGSLIWSGNAGASITAPDEEGVSQPLTGFGAGDGYLVVPAGKVLTSWKLSGS